MDLPTKFEEIDRLKMQLDVERAQNCTLKLERARAMSAQAQQEILSQQAASKKLSAELAEKYKLGEHDEVNPETGIITRAPVRALPAVS